LHLAAYKGFQDILKLLLDRGANIDAISAVRLQPELMMMMMMMKMMMMMMMFCAQNLQSY
jgi:Ankyrin repeat